ncbi:NHLP family bacteriocin export ABC transporter peptidase/permease/ATPase subunit [Legionella nagasakiensis]|uniref:NHLP family bacteriocin export ABC transporter peptidase/permease/ATPase subunit n=1 Tax=Legionella nagasakiensis TaxID=535290 RepID=UPI001054AC3D|nr:NHLP family bacteriocin export ABC transporter peptidase/permease/ATPase subunit [Legionella nagasakiensis]
MLVNLFSTRIKTPTRLQMEAVECGAVALGIILSYHGRWLPLDVLRSDCGVSRDGSRADNIYRAAEKHGMKVSAYSLELQEVKNYYLPAIIHWEFNHFVVLEAVTDKYVYINDPANGARKLTWSEFDDGFTGIFLELKPDKNFQKYGQKPRILPGLLRRLRHSKSAVCFVILTTLALAVPGIAIPGITKIFIDNVLVQQMQGWLRPVLIGLLLAAIFQGILTWLQQSLLMRLEIKLSVVNASEFFWHLLRLPMAFFSQRYIGDIQQRLQSSDAVAKLVSQQFGTNAVNVLLTLIYLIVLLLLSVPLAIIAVLLTSLNAVVLMLINKKRADESHRQTKAMNKMMSTAISGLQMIETYKASGAETDFFRKFSGQHANYLQAEQRLGIVRDTISVIPNVLSLLGNTAILGFGGWLVIQGKMTIGTVIGFQMLYGNFNQPISNLVMMAGMLQETIADLFRIDDVVSHKEAARYHPIKKSLVSSSDKLIGHVKFDDVTFGYSPLAEPLLTNFCLEIRPGRRVALVGGSGSGKSTIGKLLAGHYEAWSGQISIDGVVLAKIPNEVRTRSIASVDQEMQFFEASLKDNLTLWDPIFSDEDIHTACRMALIHETIAEQRAEGYESIIKEGGSNFSGGQRQRLEIARALLQKPSVLILDEATSALDPKMEQIIDNNIRFLGCTVLVISHRLSTIRDCDEIIVLDRGQVVERGTHKQLMAKQGMYSQLLATEA